ncbi:unnamed protein product [Lampetra fluviatilis]
MHLGVVTRQGSWARVLVWVRRCASAPRRASSFWMTKSFLLAATRRVGAEALEICDAPRLGDTARELGSYPRVRQAMHLGVVTRQGSWARDAPRRGDTARELGSCTRLGQAMRLGTSACLVLLDDEKLLVGGDEKSWSRSPGDL